MVWHQSVVRPQRQGPRPRVEEHTYMIGTVAKFGSSTFYPAITRSMQTAVLLCWVLKLIVLNQTTVKGYL